MDLEQKAKENIAILELSLQKQKCYNAVASRAYYAVFQRIKHCLTSNEFDYILFLKKIEKVKERSYSHGTIKRALIDYMLTTGTSLEKLQPLNYFDFLYNKRINADYKENKMTEKDIKLCLKNAQNIIRLIDKL